MELKSYGHILRNKLLFSWAPAIRPLVYRFYSATEAPVFVLGNQKSGTSAIAALLARACGLSYDIDIGGFRVPEYDALYEDRRRLPELIRSRAAIEFSKGLVKEPNLTFLLPEIRSLHPRSRLVFVVRDPRANIRSTLNRLKIPGDLPSINPAEYPELSPMWQAILYNKWVGNPDRDLNYIGRAAERWQIATDLFFGAGEAITPIRYEDFRVDKLTAIHNLADALNLPVVADVTKLLDVQFQPAGQKTSDYPGFFGPDNLTIIEKECARGMSLFNYPPSLTH
ncbi:MAG: hypothetical protein AB8H12_20325 [Lewinella sp.]